MSKDNNDDETSQSSSGRMTAGFVLMFLVLYILSPGPFILLVGHMGAEPTGWIKTVVEAFFFPLEWASKNTWLGDFLEWYVQLWF